jgi:flagellin-like hook-associated protein FlgL
MKTIRTLATIMIAAFLVFGPLAAFGATSTMTLSTNAPSSGVSGQTTVTVSGTITPAPTVASNVVLTTRGPNGAADIGSTPVTTGTGTFSYSLVTGGNAAWVSGTFTVNGTWGASGNTAVGTTSFLYTATGGNTGSTTTVTSTVTTSVGSVTVTSISTTTVGTVTSTITSTSTVGTVTTTVTSGSGSNDTAALAQLQTSVNAISQAVTGLQTTLTNISSGLATLGSVGNQITSMNTAVNNDQTYVLVVAALAAIVLVLELAILVRKLS